MTRSEAVRSSYDAVAQRYAEEIGEELIGKPIDRALYGCFAELVRTRPAPVAVGDVGCGPGHVARYLAGLGLSVVGVDISPGMVAVARLRHPHLRFDGGHVRRPAGAGRRVGRRRGAVLDNPPGPRRAPRRLRRAGPGDRRRRLAAGRFHISDESTRRATSRHLDGLVGHAGGARRSTSSTRPRWPPTSTAAGFAVMSRTDREPWPGVEHAEPAGLPARATCSSRRSAPRGAVRCIACVRPARSSDRRDGRVRVAGCASGPTPRAWAASVCEALGPWRAEIGTLTARTQQQMTAATTPAQAKENLVRLFGGAETASETRPAAGRAGRRARRRRRRRGRGRLRGLAERGARRVRQGPRPRSRRCDDRGRPFYDGVAAVVTLNKEYGGSALDTTKLDSPELKQAFDEVPECH